MRSLSKIIKAAELSVILSDDETKIIRSHRSDEDNGLPLEERQGPMAKAAITLEHASERAEALVIEAQREAESLVEAARSEQDALRLQAKQAGWNEGFTEGMETGRSEAHDEAKQLIQSLEKTIETACEARAEALKQLEPDFLKLALLLAEKIMRRQISEDPTWLAPVISDALERLSAANEITIRIHPKDYLPLQDLESAWPDYRGKLNWEADDALQRGTLIFETEFGAIDASFEQRLHKLAESLSEVIYHGDE